MPVDRSAPLDTDVREWVERVVSEEIRQLLDQGDKRAPHLQAEESARLEWMAQHFIPADPESLSFCDGPPGDGGVDVFLDDRTDVESCFYVYQAFSPKLSKIERGQLSSAGDKLEDDARQFHHVISGEGRIRERQLNDTAEAAIGRIIQRIEATISDESLPPVRIVIQPIHLAQVPATKRDRYELLQKEATEKWGKPGRVIWELRDPQTATDLHHSHINKRPSKLPRKLTIPIRGGFARGHREKGPWLAFALAHPFVNAYRDYQAGLFDANLRYYLGSKTEVNQRILEAIRHPSSLKWFHLNNNGIVITATAVSSAKQAHEPENTLTLSDPQVINGAQTIVTLEGERSRLSAIPVGNLTSDEKECLRYFDESLLLPVKIVVESDPARIDRIAIASNTQNPLSPRTLRSTADELRIIRLAVARLQPAWFLETKDGEWNAICQNKDIVQSRTGRSIRDFGSGSNRRLIDNTDLGVGLLAFYGFLDEAKPSRIFKKNTFSTLFGSRIKDDAWTVLSLERLRWGDSGGLARILDDGVPTPSQCLLAFLLSQFWRRWTFPDSRQEHLAFEEYAERHPKFRENYYHDRSWKVPDETADKVTSNSDSCYWVERIAKSAQQVLIYQSMRLLVRVYGMLIEPVCARILRAPQFCELAEGKTSNTLPDFRKSALTEGPLTAMGLILRSACAGLWVAHEAQIRKMLSPQQEMLSDEWVQRLSDQVDRIAAHFPRVAGNLEIVPSGRPVPPSLGAALGLTGDSPIASGDRE